MILVAVTFLKRARTRARTRAHHRKIESSFRASKPPPHILQCVEFQLSAPALQ